MYRKLTNWFINSSTYMAAGLGGVMMGLMDYLQKAQSESVIFKIGNRLTELLPPQYALSGTSIALLFLAGLGVIVCWMKKPTEKWDSFIIGFAAFAVVSALLPQTVENRWTQNDDIDQHYENQLDGLESSIYWPMQNNKNGINLFEIVSASHAATENKLESNSQFLLYLKGGKYQKVVRSKITVYSETEEIGTEYYRGNRVLLKLREGSYQLKIAATTYSNTDFQFYVDIEIQGPVLGGIIDIEANGVTPTSTISKFTRSFEKTELIKFNQFETNKQLGILNSIEANYSEAISFYEKSIINAKGSDVTGLDLSYVSILKGYAYYRNGEFGLAEPILESVYSSEYSTNYAWINLIKVYCAVGKLSKAKIILDEGLPMYQEIFQKDGEVHRECPAEIFQE